MALLRPRLMSASLIGRSRSSSFRLSTIAVLMSLAGSRFYFELGTRALPSWDSKTRWNNLFDGLAVQARQVQADMRTRLIHCPARDIIPPLGEVAFPPIEFDHSLLLCRCGFPGPAELGAVAPIDHRSYSREASERALGAIPTLPRGPSMTGRLPPSST